MDILIVDDSRSVHSFYKSILNQFAGVTYNSAFDGSEAVEILVDKKEEYKIIFLDWEMPNKDGPTTLKELREKNISTPIVMVTTKNNMNDIKFSFECGANDYIMKPFTKEILQQKLIDFSILGNES